MPFAAVQCSGAMLPGCDKITQYQGREYTGPQPGAHIDHISGPEEAPYFQDTGDAEHPSNVSHSVCPDCEKKEWEYVNSRRERLLAERAHEQAENEEAERRIRAEEERRRRRRFRRGKREPEP